MISDAQIARGLAPYQVTPTRRLKEQIRDYISLLLLWNQKISLTTITEPDEVIRFHFGESFFAVRTVPLQIGRLADVGSGAGFPGIPIAMLAPDIEVTLIEANLKKATFLAEAIRKLDLANTRVLRVRMSEIKEGLFDFIAARAMGPHKGLAQWSSRHLAPAGRLILWMGEGDAAVISHESGWIWQGPIGIPGSRRRVLLIGSRTTN